VAFVQLVEFKTSKADEMKSLVEEWARTTEGKRTARRWVLGQDRDNSGSYCTIVFFDSYESAMENSELPETDALSKKLMDLSDGPPTFHNLDVVEDGS
jgi:quinol monooxygenase YgiN